MDSEHVTGGFRARQKCERLSNVCVLKSVMLVISVCNYQMDKCRQKLHEIKDSFTYRITEQRSEIQSYV